MDKKTKNEKVNAILLICEEASLKEKSWYLAFGRKTIPFAENI